MKGFYSVCVLALIFALWGCEDKCKSKSPYFYYEPVYSTISQIRAATGLKESREIANPGKIYLKDNFLLIGEVGRGIHLINNIDPTSPVQVGFLSIPGNNDMATWGNTLYADSFVDLVVFDITNMKSIREVNRIGNFFSSRKFHFQKDSGLFLTDWVRREEVRVNESDCNAQVYPSGGAEMHGGGVIFREADYLSMLKSSYSPINASGVGGSMARFTIASDHLYVLDQSNINVLDVSVQHLPKKMGSVVLASDIETLFPYEDKLFVGSQTGMYILSISNPDNPELLSTYRHLRSCDPVVVEGNYAYVTLRNGSACAGFLNQLEVIDLTDIVEPRLVATYPMTNPHGLGIDNKILFICDGDDGLKIYDASDILNVDKNQLAHYKNIHAFDVIPSRKVAILIGETGLFQYDYSNASNISLLSTIRFSE